MNFPENLEAMTEVIVARRNAAQKAIIAIEEAQRQTQTNQRITNILVKLCVSWQESDPGKNGAVYFFLGRARSERVVVREFLPEGTKICQTQKEWDNYSRTKSRHGANDQVPYWYPVVNLDAVGKDECSKCKTPQLLVEHYEQTYDSSDGDEWLKEHFVLCLDCNSTTVLKSETSNSRF